jgi:transcriptional regulator with XRE-family HTH domain
MEMREPRTEDEVLDRKEAENLVQQLADLRRKQGLSQREVGRRMGVGQQTISQLENGRSHTSNYHSPFLSTLQRYARAVGAEIDFEVVPLKKGKG